MPRRALAKKITRKQAESYERTAPNPMGVTAIAAVNGPGAYERRYDATRALLGKPAKPKRKRKTTKNRSKATTRKASPKKRTKTRSSSMRRGTSTRRRPTKRHARKSSARKSHGTVYKRDFIDEQMAIGRSRAQAESAWKLARGAKKKATPNKRKKKAAPKRKRQKRVYGKGKYKALRARVGGKSRPTYMYRTKKGNLRKIPKHGYLGYRSSAEMRAAHRRSPRKAEQDAERWDRAIKRRERASIRAVEGKSMFTPNRRRRSADITFEEWEQEMKANARRRRKKTTRRKKKTSTKRKPARRKTTRRKASTRRKTTSRKRSTTRRKPARRKASTRRRKSGSTSKKRRATRRKKTTRRRVRRNPRRVTQVAANRRRRRKSSSRKRRASSRSRGYAKNRRRKRKTRKNRKTLRNQAKTFGKDLMQVLKVGGVVVVGYLAHRALTRVLSDSVLSNVAMFQSGSGAAYKDVAAGAIVAAVGVPLTAKFAPKDAKMLGAGMAASLLQNAIVTVLSQMGQSQVVAYLGDYTEAEGSPQYSGMGSYYEFYPGQTFGEYYTQPGMSGFGQDLTVGQLTQAAAGMGQSQLPQLYQAAAGMGQNGGGAMLTQAAAGYGEYIVQGANGIGEYEQVTPQYTAPAQMDEGISPDLDSAERAMSIAEAAAGVGAFGDSDVPLQSTVYPTGVPEAIPDMPGGSRAGTFAGGNGVFGPGH